MKPNRSSVTSLGYFWKFFVTKFLTKVAQFICNFFGYFEKHYSYLKTYVSNFWKHLGYFLLEHLVTLNRSITRDGWERKRERERAWGRPCILLISASFIILIGHFCCRQNCTGVGLTEASLRIRTQNWQVCRSRLLLLFLCFAKDVLNDGDGSTRDIKCVFNFVIN